MCVPSVTGMGDETNGYMMKLAPQGFIIAPILEEEKATSISSYITC